MIAFAASDEVVLSRLDGIARAGGGESALFAADGEQLRGVLGGLLDAIAR